MLPIDSLSFLFLVQPATVAGGCLTGRLPFLYIVESNDSRFGNGMTTSTSYTVTNITQETVVVITISPSLPFLGLTGSPLSKTLNLGKSYKLLHVHVHLQPICALNLWCIINPSVHD